MPKKQMKRTTLQLFSLIILCVLFGCAQPTKKDGIDISAENFPDENFRNYLFAQEYGSDGVLTEDELKGITHIEVARADISDLTGIKHFTALRTLDCRGNQSLTSIDVSGCTALVYLECNNSGLTSVDVTGCTALQYMNCAENQLTKLDVSTCTALRYLDGRGNRLTAMSVTGCTALDALLCSGNPLETLDVSTCTALTTIDCSQKLLETLDVSDCTALELLSCDGKQVKTHQRHE